MKDVSWLWHCSTKKDNIINSSSSPHVDRQQAKAFDKGAQIGFRLALRKLEDLGLIEMADIDRSINEADQEIFDKHFK